MTCLDIVKPEPRTVGEAWVRWTNYTRTLAAFQNGRLQIPVEYEPGGNQTFAILTQGRKTWIAVF